jgi:hypothetical protein
MNSTTDTPRNMATLEQLLADLRVEHPATAKAMTEAITICQSRSVVYAGVSFQLRTALAWIREGHPKDAVQHIENALAIKARWAGKTQA